MTTFQYISIGLSVLSILLVAIGFLITVYTLKRNHDWNRRNASAIALQVISDPARIADLEVLNSAFNYTDSNEPILLAHVLEKTKENSRVLQVLLVRLNMFEMFAIGINQGVYDEQYIKATIGPAMSRAFRRFQYFVEHHRQFTRGYCGYLEHFALRWELEAKSSPNRSKTA